MWFSTIRDFFFSEPHKFDDINYEIFGEEPQKFDKKLPTDIHYKIMDFLDNNEVHNISLVSKSIFDQTKSTQLTNFRLSDKQIETTEKIVQDIIDKQFLSLFDSKSQPKEFNVEIAPDGSFYIKTDFEKETAKGAIITYTEKITPPPLYSINVTIGSNITAPKTFTFSIPSSDIPAKYTAKILDPNMSRTAQKMIDIAIQKLNKKDYQRPLES